MKRFLIISGLVLGATLVPVRSIAATFSQLVVYGDSLSDLGRAAAATNGQIPGYTQGGGRFSNGPIWIEYLAARLGIATNSNTNFAIGGAITGTFIPGQALPPSFIGIQQQINPINDSDKISDPNALYVIWGGANDYLGGTTRDPKVPVGNLTSEISTLITTRQAKNILVLNLPDLGKLPSTRIDSATAAGLDALTQAHNTGLATSINVLSQSNPTVKLNLLDVNSLFKQVVAKPSSFEFDNVTDQCFISSTNICSTPSTYLFWDDRHPTTAGHKLIGDLAFQVVSPTTVPEPMTILGSLMAFGSAIAFKRKIKPSNLKDQELIKID
jgi:thermolabile hemolysin